MSIARRLSKLEADRSPPPPRMPHVLTVNTFIGETDEEARAKFEQQWGPIPAHHRFLVVPKRVETPEEEEQFKRTFFERQTRLRAEMIALRRTPKEEPAQ